MRICYEEKLDFDDVLIEPKRSNTPSRSIVDLKRKYITLNSRKEISGIPLIAANLDTTGTLAMAHALSKLESFTSLHKFYDEDTLIRIFNDPVSEYCFYTLGINESDIAKLKSVKSKSKITKIIIDVANGYTSHFQNKVKEIRQLCPECIIVAGNVATSEMTQELLLSGADIVKVGIGPGKFCTTRLITGVGVPQFSAIVECADSAHGLGGHIIADGGCRYPGDVVKAIAAGADFVMLGGMLSGTDECEGEWDENKNLTAYGMSSKEAMEKYSGEVSSYRASEGRCLKIKHKGPAEKVIQEILGGLRSACSYVGAAKLKYLSKCTKFNKCKRVHSNMDLS